MFLSAHAGTTVVKIQIVQEPVKPIALAQSSKLELTLVSLASMFGARREHKIVSSLLQTGTQAIIA